MSNWRPRTFFILGAIGIVLFFVGPVLAGFGIGESGISYWLLFLLRFVAFLLILVGFRFAFQRRREIDAEATADPHD